MLARGTQEFAFRIIDPAEPPNKRARPKRVLVVIIGTLAGGVISLIWIFLGHALRS
jgi:LPS O-antigen subunit length determinant protein (WzzB/FepE family)